MDVKNCAHNESSSCIEFNYVHTFLAASCSAAFCLALLRIFEVPGGWALSLACFSLSRMRDWVGAFVNGLSSALSSSDTKNVYSMRSSESMCCLFNLLLIGKNVTGSSDVVIFHSLLKETISYLWFPPEQMGDPAGKAMKACSWDFLLVNPEGNLWILDSCSLAIELDLLLSDLQVEKCCLCKTVVVLWRAHTEYSPMP